MTPPRAPTVTVVTGYYNRAERVTASVRSVLQQSLEDFEYLVFDDASTDGTYDALIAIEDPRLRVIRHEQNQGFVAGLRGLLESARAPFVAIHGAGDVSHPERLRMQVDLLRRAPDIAAVGCYRQNTDGDGRVLSEVRPPAKNLTLARLLRRNAFSHGEVTFRKAAYDAVGGYRDSFTYAQDYDLWLRLARHHRLAIVPEMLYTRVIGHDNVSFHPTKLLRQAKYAELARTLAIAPERTDALLGQLAIEGIDAVVLDANPAIWATIEQKVLALVALARPSDARDLLARYRGPGWRRSALHGLVRLTPMITSAKNVMTRGARAP